MAILQQQTNGIVHPNHIKPNGVKNQNGNVHTAKNGSSNGSVQHNKHNQYSFQNGLVKEGHLSKVSQICNC